MGERVTKKEPVLTLKEAQRLATAAKQRQSKTVKVASTWKKGGKEWSRILGHFGSSQKRA